jgi:hypothetical protein
MAREIRGGSEPVLDEIHCDEGPAPCLSESFQSRQRARPESQHNHKISKFFNRLEARSPPNTTISAMCAHQSPNWMLQHTKMPLSLNHIWPDLIQNRHLM